MSFATASASFQPAASAVPVTRACADNDNKRSRSSVSKPFMTDRITISAATPTHTPISDTQVMNETKNFRVRERT